MLTGTRNHHGTRHGRRLLGAGCAALLAVVALAACGPDEPDDEGPSDPLSVEVEESADGDADDWNSGDGDSGNGDSGSEGADDSDSGVRTGADAWRAPFDEVGHEWSSGWVALPASAEDIESILEETAPEIREGTEKMEIEVDCVDGIDGTSPETTCTVTAADEELGLPEVTWRVIGEVEEGGADLTVRNEG